MKKILSLVLVLAMVLCAVPLSFAEKEGGQTITGYKYDFSGIPFYYEDSYFTADATEYNASLATLSLFGATAAYYYEPESDGAKHDVGAEFLQKCGFENIISNDDYKTVSGEDTIGVICGVKKLDDGNALVAVLVRNSTYPSDDGSTELTSNVTAGKEGEAEGYSEAASEVVDTLTNYIKTAVSNDYVDNSGNVKIWMTGYSRGGAAVNLAAVRISELMSVQAANNRYYSFPKERVYAYTFEAAKAGNTSVVSAAEAATYTNIHNIVDPSNMLTYLFPSEWGFIRYGVDENVIPVYSDSLQDLYGQYIDKSNEYDEDYENHKDFNNALVEGTYWQGYYLEEMSWQSKDFNLTAESLSNIALWNTGWEFQNWKFYEKNIFKDTDVSFNSSLQQLVNKGVKAIGSRGVYVQNYENALRAIVSGLTGYADKEVYVLFLNTVTAKLREKFDDAEFLDYIVNAISFNEAFTDIITESLEEAGLRSEKYTQFSSAILTITPVASYTFWAMLAQGGSEEIISLIYNWNAFVGHFDNVESDMVWLQLQDPNYNANYASVVEAITGVKPVTSVTVSQTSKTEKTGKLKIKVKKYTVNIQAEGATSIKYRLTDLSAYKSVDGSGNTESSLIKYPRLYIEVTDAANRTTYWYWNGSTCVQR